MPAATFSLAAVWGENVRRRREALNFSQQQLAAFIAERGHRSCTQQTISKIERGILIPRDELKLVLAAALFERPEKLFPWPKAVA